MAQSNVSVKWHVVVYAFIWHEIVDVVASRIFMNCFVSSTLHHFIFCEIIFMRIFVKLIFTHVTFVYLSFFMNYPYMSFQVFRLSKGFATNTFVNFFTFMNRSNANFFSIVNQFFLYLNSLLKR